MGAEARVMGMAPKPVVRLQLSIECLFPAKGEWSSYCGRYSDLLQLVKGPDSIRKGGPVESAGSEQGIADCRMIIVYTIGR